MCVIHEMEKSFYGENSNYEQRVWHVGDVGGCVVDGRAAARNDGVDGVATARARLDEILNTM